MRTGSAGSTGRRGGTSGTAGATGTAGVDRGRRALHLPGRHDAELRRPR